jgi:hypothetical protein
VVDVVSVYQFTPSVFRFLLGGTGSTIGVRDDDAYVTVRVTTCRTLTAVDRPLFSGSHGSRGDIAALYGEYTEAALMGDLTLAGEYGL